MAQLVIQTAFLGDVLLSVPLLKRVKALKPNEPLYLLCRQGLGDFIREQQIADVVIEINKKSKESQLQAIEQLTQQEYSNIVCPHESLRSALIVKKLKADNKIGFSHWWNFFIFNKRVPRLMKYPDALRQLYLLVPLDADLKDKLAQLGSDLDNSSSKVAWQPQRPIPDWASMQLDSKESFTGNRILISPGSVWKTKRWRKDYFIELGNQLQHENYEIFITGSAAERDLCQEVAEAISQAQVFCGKTLSEMHELMKSSRALITNDSGAMHMASLIGLPTVSIFGPTTLTIGYRPWNSNVRVEQIDLGCRPCGKHGSKSCPIKTHDCMKLVTVAQVKQSLDRLLQK